MSLLHINYGSKALGKQSAMYAVLPEGDGPFRVVYELHGYSDDYTIWLRRSNIERYAEELGLMVVLLDGSTSFYIDSRAGHADYEKHILESVSFIDRTFHTIASPAGRAIGGLSMGGYGCVKIGLKYPELFGSVASHSGAVDLAAMHANANDTRLRGMLGEQMPPEEDCFALAELPNEKPAIYFDCGVDDFLIEQNRRFHTHLTELGVPHVYVEHPGDHCWAYWDEHITDALKFHIEHLAGEMSAK